MKGPPPASPSMVAAAQWLLLPSLPSGCCCCPVVACCPWLLLPSPLELPFYSVDVAFNSFSIILKRVTASYSVDSGLTIPPCSVLRFHDTVKLPHVIKLCLQKRMEKAYSFKIWFWKRALQIVPERQASESSIK